MIAISKTFHASFNIKPDIRVTLVAVCGTFGVNYLRFEVQFRTAIVGVLIRKANLVA